MTDAANETQGTPGREERARRVIEHLRLLQGDKLDHAFAIGHLLVEWEEQGLYGVVGHATQDAIIAEVGLKRATALSNKRLARKFDLATFRHIGLGKLRLLAANYVDDPARILYDGITVIDDAGAAKRVSVEDLSYRELQTILRTQNVAAKLKEGAGKDADLAGAIQAAMTPVLASFNIGEEVRLEAVIEAQPAVPTEPATNGSATKRSKPLANPALAAAVQVTAASMAAEAIRGVPADVRPSVASKVGR